MQSRYGHHHYWLWMFSRLPYGLRVVVMVFIAAWVALALHELAHALAARLLGVRIWSITLGPGTGAVGRVRGPVPGADRAPSAARRGAPGRRRRRAARLPEPSGFRLGIRLARRELLARPIISGAGGIANLLGAKAVLLYWIAMPKLLPQLYSLSACIFVVNAIMFLNLAPIRGLDGWRLAVQTAAWRRAPRLQAP